MEPLHYILILGGIVLLVVVVVILTARRDPPPSSGVAGAYPMADNSIATGATAFGSGLGALIGGIAQSEVNAGRARETTRAQSTSSRSAFDGAAAFLADPS